MTSSAPLDILILGAGLGGCAAAYCLVRNGHRVTVLEQRTSLSPAGSGLMIRPNASRVLISWGLEPTLSAICDTSPSTVIRSVTTGHVLQRRVAIDTSDTPDWGIDRETLLQILYDKAVDFGAVFHFDATMSSVSDTSTSATVVLRSGQAYTGDLLIAADGIRSRTRPLILSDVTSSIDPVISRNSLFAMRVPNSTIAASSSAAQELTKSTHLTVYMAPNQYVVARSHAKTKTFGGLFATIEDTGQKGLWDEEGDINFVRKAYSNATPALKEVLKLTDKCERWKLAEMPDLPRWTSLNGRIILLGDSAHGMLPNAAQGFSQIVEDIGALEYLLKAKGERKLAEVTRSWEEIRKPRVERIKAFANWNTKVFLGEDHLLGMGKGIDSGPGEGKHEIKSLKNVKGDMNAPVHTSAFLKWAQDYDVVKDCARHMRDAGPKL